MLRSMFSGLAGLINHKTALDVIGNNIANVNTIGFKSGRVTFQELISQTVSGATAPSAAGLGGINAMQVGLGAKIGSIDLDMSQGNLQSTGTNTDLALEGAGFFILSDGGTNYRYTRAGNFRLDAQGNLVYPSGLRAQGWQADAVTGDINTNDAISSLSIPSGRTIAANPTGTVTYGYNLASNANIMGQSELQAGNSAGVSTISGVWSGVAIGGIAGTYDQEGTHTITIMGAQSIGERTSLGAGLLTQDMTLDNLETATGGNIANYDLHVIVDGADTTLTFTGADTVGEVIQSINSQISGVTATLQDGNIRILRSVAGNTRTVEVSDTVACDGTNCGLSDLLMSSNPLNIDYTSTDMTTASTTWSYNPESSTAADFSGDTTNLAFGGSDDTITGMQGVSIDAASGGFRPGVFIVNTLPAETYSCSTRVYDSLGNPRNVTLSYERTGDNVWTWTASGAGVNGGGALNFNNNGRFLTATNADNVTLAGLNGSLTQTLNLDYNNITQYYGDSSVISTTQDGYAQGSMESFSIDQIGRIVGRFTNGLNQNLAQLAVANFNNPNGLQKLADTTFGETNNAGDPQIGAASLGGRGKISTGTLEMSNVDIAQEFSNMIIYQRGFQANSKVITTGDEMLTTVVNIKR